MIRRSPHRLSAFSLLELLVAAVILAAGLVVVLQGISLGVRSSAMTNAKAAAYRLADNRLHRAAQGELAVGDTGEHRVAGGLTLRWRIETDAHEQGCRELRCVVTWPVSEGDSQVELTRLVQEAGP